MKKGEMVRIMALIGAVLVVVFGNISNLWRTVRFGWKNGRK